MTISVPTEKGKTMKGKINTALKVFVMVFSMLMGVFFTYAFIWFLLDLPAEEWAIILLFALSSLSMVGFVFWIKDDDAESAVVHCDECKHWKDFDGHRNCVSTHGLDAAMADDYCSHGERR